MSISQYVPMRAMKVFRGILLLSFLITIGTCAKAQQRSIPLVAVEGFVFQFKGCQISANSDEQLTCDFLVKNSKRDRRNLLIKRGKVIDNKGNVINNSFLRLGDDSGSFSVNQELPTEIPIKGSISFPQAPEGNIVFLELRVYAGKYFNVEFFFE